jgi:hypothetical protein
MKMSDGSKSSADTTNCDASPSFRMVDRHRFRQSSFDRGVVTSAIRI